MKSLFPKIRLTGARWDVLTVVFVSLTGMVCLLYAVVFLYPQVLPMALQVPTRTPTQTPLAARAVQGTRPFPTFPAEWTAAYATRRSQVATPTLTPLGSSNQGVSPTSSLAATVATNLPASVTPTPPASLTPTASLASPIAPEATVTATETAATPLPSPDTPVPTASPQGYTGYPEATFPPSDYPP